MDNATPVHVMIKVELGPDPESVLISYHPDLPQAAEFFDSIEAFGCWSEFRRSNDCTIRAARKPNSSESVSSWDAIRRACLREYQDHVKRHGQKSHLYQFHSIIVQSDIVEPQERS